MLATSQDQQKYKLKGDDWYDIKHDNPGNFGDLIPIGQTITNIIKPQDMRDLDRPWKQGY